MSPNDIDRLFDPTAEPSAALIEWCAHVFDGLNEQPEDAVPERLATEIARNAASLAAVLHQPKP